MICDNSSVLKRSNQRLAIGFYIYLEMRMEMKSSIRSRRKENAK